MGTVAKKKILDTPMKKPRWYRNTNGAEGRKLSFRT